MLVPKPMIILREMKAHSQHSAPHAIGPAMVEVKAETHELQDLKALEKKPLIEEE